MSENREVNVPFNDHNDLPPDVSRILGGLNPQPLEVNRDELFFQAGFAAGRSGRASRYFWPLAVAAMVMACVGLGAMLIWQARSIRELQTELAVAERADAQSIARSGTTAKPQADGERYDGERFLINERQRGWQRLALLAPLPPGRLTALGWEESPRGLRSGQWEMGDATGELESSRSAQPETAPRRPATYLELMRQQREG